MIGGLRFVHLDGWCAVIDKPGGLLSVPGRGPDKQDSVVSRLRCLLPWCLAQPAVHRLDMATSGLMVLALTAPVHRHLSAQFARRQVAKEYVAAQNPEDPGVLILSRFAGAAEQMGEALIINPFSREETSEALGQALAMPRAERIARWRRLMDGVSRDDVSAWRDRFVAALAADASDDAPTERHEDDDSRKAS